MGVGGERCVLLEVVGYVSSRFKKVVEVMYVALEHVIDAINIGLAHFATGHDRCDL